LVLIPASFEREQATNMPAPLVVASSREIAALRFREEVNENMGIASWWLANG
jgi:hypothetical protein